MNFVYPPELFYMHNHCFQLDITVVPREIEDDSHAKFWEVNKAW